MVRCQWSGASSATTDNGQWTTDSLLLDAAFLGRPAAVVRQRGDVLNGLDREASGLQGGDRRLPSRAGALDAHLNFFEAELGGSLGRRFGGALGGERRTLAASLESDRACRGVRQRIVVRIGNGDDRVVKGRLDAGDPA